MNNNAKRGITAALLFIAFLIGWFWTPFLLIALAASAAIFYRAAWVMVPEWHIGVVYNRERQAFGRLLPAGRHFVWPGIEQLRANIKTVGQSASATSAMQAKGGLTLKVEWSVSYALEPGRLSPQKQSQLALKLATKSSQIVRKYTVNTLQHIVGDLSLNELNQPGAHALLERDLRQQLRTRLTDLGFKVSKVMIGQIHLPEYVLAALEAAHEQELKAEQEARTLERLHQVVSKFSEGDMQRLMELERIHMLGQNGVALMYPAPAGPEPSQGWLRPTDLLAPLQLN